jgi:hypothetical protein
MTTKSDTSEKLRWALHRSTVVFVVLLCVPYLLIALPMAKNSDFPVWIHGWPAIHCVQIHERQIAEGQTNQEAVDRFLFDPYQGFLSEQGTDLQQMADRPFHWAKYCRQNGNKLRIREKHHTFWTDKENWNFFGGQRATRWYPLGVIVNLGSFLGYFLALSVFLEWLRRRKKRWYQITILELGLFCVLIGSLVVPARNEHRRTIKLTEALNDLSDSTTNTSFWIQTTPPVWLERLTNLGLDTQARNVWPFHIGENDSFPTTRLPWFSRVELTTDLNHRNFKDLDNAIAAIECTQQRHLTLDLSTRFMGNQVYEFARRVNTDRIETLNIKGVDPEVDFLNRFKDLKSLALDGEITSKCFEGLDKGKLRTLTMHNRILLDSDFPELLQSFEKLESLSFVSRSIFDQVAEFVPENLKTISVDITAVPNGEPAFDFRRLPDLDQLESIHLRIFHQATMTEPAKLPEITMGDLNRFPALKRLEIYNQPDFRRLRLQKLGLELSTLPNLRMLSLSGLDLDDVAKNWVDSHPRLSNANIGR